MTAKKTKNQFIAQAIAIHGDEYDYSKVIYQNTDYKVEIFCNCCKKYFSQTPHDHLRGAGCAKCAGRTISKASQRWLDHEKVPNIMGVTREVKINIPKRKRPFIVDGYDPKTKTIYEFHGDFWHGNPKLFDPNKKNGVNKKTFGKLFLETTKRSQLLRKHGYKIKSIWESDWEKIEKELLLKETA